MLRLAGADLPGARAVVFDKDGVLVDFAPLWCAIASERARAIAEGAGLADAERELLLVAMGVPGGAIDPTGPLATGSRAEELAIAASFLYARGRNWLEARAIVESGFEAADRAVDPAEHVRPTGPLASTLAALSKHGIRLALATTDTTANAERDLRLLGLHERFEAILGADRVARNKPHPDLFVRCCEIMGVAPGEAWMVGDGLNDLRMARAAGAAAAIGVASGVTSRELLETEADLVLQGAWELSERAVFEAPAAPTIDPETWYALYTDGASRGNPGPAAYGAVLRTPDGTVLSELSETIGVTTNNVAEYQALLHGLAAARGLGVRRLVVRADSELMIKQLKGDYAVKSDVLRPLHRQAQEHLRAFAAYKLEHVRREHNREADALANKALDALND